MYLFSRIGHLKKIILKGRGFRCGSDEKMMRMWFGLEIADVVGLPPLVIYTSYTYHYTCSRTVKVELLFIKKIENLLTLILLKTPIYSKMIEILNIVFTKIFALNFLHCNNSVEKS